MQGILALAKAVLEPQAAKIESEPKIKIAKIMYFFIVFLLY